MPTSTTIIYKATREIRPGDSVTPDKDLAPETRHTVTCECGRHEHTATWVQEKAAEDANEVPDSFFGILTLTRAFVDPEATNDPGRYTFFGAECLMKWLETYRPYPSPRQKLAAKVVPFPGAIMYAATTGREPEPK